VPEALLPCHAASSLGSRARLFAAIVRIKRERTRSMPRYTVWAIPPTVLAQRMCIIQAMRRRFPARRIDLPDRLQLFRSPRQGNRV
jgi:hypothetical protein